MTEHLKPFPGNKHCCDKHGHIIKQGMKVRFIGECRLTDEHYTMASGMKTLVRNGNFMEVHRIRDNKLIVVQGYSWHPFDCVVHEDDIIDDVDDDYEEENVIVSFDPQQLCL